jgi:hypothetical protein
MTTTATALPVSIETVEFVRMDPTVGWERRLVLDTERRTVEVRESVGNGRSEREYYGLDPVLGGLPLDLATFDRIGAYLASDTAQTLLRSLCDDDFSADTDEDGSEAWQDIVHRLNDGITEAVKATPRYWDAGDYFQYTDDDDLFDGVPTEGSIDEALDKRAHDLCGEAALDGNRLAVSEVRHYLNRKWNDAVADAVAYFGSDLDALATDADLWGDFDAGTQTFADLVGACADAGHLFPAAAKTVLLLARPSAAS